MGGGGEREGGREGGGYETKKERGRAEEGRRMTG